VNNNQRTVFVDDEVASQVTDIVKEAKQYVILITPYINLWRHVQTELGLATKRGVKVTVIIRDEEWKPETREDIAWLQDKGIQVKSAEWLHAKIYLNEHAVFVSSMNLTEVSTRNSLELGLAVRESEAAKRVRDYVTNTVMPQAKPVSAPQTEPRQQPVNRRAQPEPRPRPTTPHAQSTQQTAAGACIRCRRPLYPNPDKPLCDDCYDEWAQYENEDYAERFCHICGRPWETSYARPLCRDCFRKLG
jgi:phosphatidylserine/phosphatidylglycerophosphate/cardiolipin synthase-like enzyme